MTREEIIEQLNLTIGLIKQDGKDWLDDRDIPMFEECVKALSQGPCGDAISREDAIKAQCEACDICGNMRYTKCQYFMQGCNEVKCLRDLPSVTLTCEEQEKGECPYYAG